MSGYQSVALEFGFFAYGETPEKSEQNLFSQVDEFAKSVKTNAEFIAAIENLNLENFWDTYRKITFLVGDPERLHYEKIEEENKELKQSNIDKEEEIFSLKIDLDTLNKKFNEIKIPS
ncbi:hypothetical protein [Leptospira idonii]|uniref:Uncharacterized protein n=1 Tax=Leptospira idonii TaxID=1193500 RepID=A0A4R9LUA9_9LEPT|nr:hypothetical protein [Leptospira idonii]TGN17366.1 hypothetical protein EHS15_17685 [Leptospira idonii]